MRNLKLNVTERVFHFKQPAGTSRGVYLTRHSWMVEARNPDMPQWVGVGECAPLPQLSCDDLDDYEDVLKKMCRCVEHNGFLDDDLLNPYPSMRFGLEMALKRLDARGDVIFDTPFTKGEVGIPINGLVWMGAYEEMLKRMEEKIKTGFHCVKLKIGAIDFESELELVKIIRKRFSSEDVELRLDANGAFNPQVAMAILERLARFDIHSIEQPIRQGQWKEMARVCKDSPIPIALDEELIGVNTFARKNELLDFIKPAFVILKPSLHGGFKGTEEWISLAEQRGIGSWITSALESNIGLSAIAQFAAYIYGCPLKMPQGLGTGQLFTDNIAMPLKISGDKLFYQPQNITV